MTIAFWDSSAFLKLLVDESGSDEAERIWDEADVATASRLAVPEVSAALAAARRAGRLDASTERRARRFWAELSAMVDMLELTEDIATNAAGLVRRHLLSGADSVHLATAMTVVEAEPILLTWDRRLAVAASEEGLVVVPTSF